MTGDHTTQFYAFQNEQEAQAFLEAMKVKGLDVQQATISQHPDGEGVLLAVQGRFPAESP